MCAHVKERQGRGVRKCSLEGGLPWSRLHFSLLSGFSQILSRSHTCTGTQQGQVQQKTFPLGHCQYTKCYKPSPKQCPASLLENSHLNSVLWFTVQAECEPQTTLSVHRGTRFMETPCRPGSALPLHGLTAAAS